MPSHWTERRVVVTGLGVVTPLGHQLDHFWRHLLAGQCGIDKITAFDTTAFDTQIAAEVKDFDPTPAFPSPKEVRRTDRFSQFGVHAAWQALQDCGAELAKLNRDEIGVIIGSGIGGLDIMIVQHKILLERGPGRMSPFMIPMLISNMASGLFSIFHNLRGPNYATVSACATANHAIGEGAGALVLEELGHARKRGAKIYCEIVGYGNIADAHHLTAPAPEGEGAARCMKMALRHGGLNP